MSYVPVPLKTNRDKKPVILQVVPGLNGSGGVERGCVDVAQAITAAGGQALVVCHGVSKNFQSELARCGAIHIDLPVQSKNPFVIWRNIGRLKRIIADTRVDIVHARSRAPAWSAYYAAGAMHVPFVTTCHAPYNMKNKWKWRYNSVMSKGVRVIAISNYVAEYLRKYFHVGDDRLRLIHRSVAIQKFHPSAVTPDRMIKIAKEWRIPDGATVILLPGRLTAWKGHKVLIDALAILNNPDLFTVFVGSDQGRSEYRAELDAHILACGLEERIRIADHTDDMPAACMLAHIIVSASTDPEGFGRVAIEGQAMGRIVIATDHGGSQETMIDGQTGFLVPPGDAYALANALRRAIDISPRDRAILGTNAIAHVAAHFTREQMMDKTISVYNELLGG